MSTNLTTAEQEGLARIKASLYDGKLAQVKRIAPTEAAAAFELIASWLDATSRVWAGGDVGSVETRMRAFVSRYFPHAYKVHARALYDGLRNALLHEYGTRGVALTENQPGMHLTTVGGLLVLDIGALVQDCDEAFQKFFAELESDRGIRGRAVAASEKLLVPIRLVPTAHELKEIVRRGYEGAIAASATSSATVVSIRQRNPR